MTDLRLVMQCSPALERRSSQQGADKLDFRSSKMANAVKRKSGGLYNMGFVVYDKIVENFIFHRFSSTLVLCHELSSAAENVQTWLIDVDNYCVHRVRAAFISLSFASGTQALKLV